MTILNNVILLAFSVRFLGRISYPCVLQYLSLRRRDIASFCLGLQLRLVSMKITVVFILQIPIL